MKKKSPWSVFAAIVLAVIAGCYTGMDAEIFGIPVFQIFDFVGAIFIKALSMVVIPLISSSIIIGMARMGADGSFGKLGAKTFGFYLGTSLMAILIGLFFVNLFHPGSPELIQHLRQLPGNEAIGASQPSLRIADIFLNLVPSNIIDAFAKGQMLSVIFFCLIFGYTISKIDAKPAATLISFGEGLFQTMIEITHLIMKFLPIGVFCLVAKVFASTGLGSLQSVALFTVSVLLGLGAFTFIGLPLLISLVGKRNPILLFKAMMPALVTGFSTSSSSATLPITMDCVEKRAGVSNRICGLVVPLGTSINMCGSALYECAAAIFVAQAYGLNLSLSTQFLVVVMALVTSMGVAGIPSGSTVAIIVILKTIGLPAEGIGLFLAVDRFLDMCRTTVNIFGDSCCAILVALTEGEKQVLSRKDMNYEISLR